MEHRIGIICNGITGRQGRCQHLKALLQIIQAGGVQISKGEYVIPELILIGRDESILASLCELHDIPSWSTDLLGALSNPKYQIYLDSQITEKRYECLLRAIRMGKVTLSEMPLVSTVKQAEEVVKIANEHGVKGGVVQNMMYLPGIIKLRSLLDSGFFGSILRASINYSCWLPDGKHQKLRHPKWLFSKEHGGIIRDFFGHVRYLVDNMIGKIKSIQCSSSTNIKKRWDADGEEFDCTAEDNAVAILESDNSILTQVTASWTTRINSLDIFTIQVDGTLGSAVTTLRNCYLQPAPVTPLPKWDPQNSVTTNYMGYWHAMPDHDDYPCEYKMLWESFLKYVFTDYPWYSGIEQGLRDVTLIECALKSSQSGNKQSIADQTLIDG